MTNQELPATIGWLHSLPCVADGRVIIDTRGVWPVAIIGLIAEAIETREDFFNFIVSNLDL